MGTLQAQQDIYAESTKAHLNELSAAQEDLYKSLLDAESINTVTDIMTGLTEATTTWVDSLGGGIGVLKNLGALGTTVFSKQIAGGINNAISSMTRSSSNKKIIENAFQQAVNLQNITDNEYTKDIIEQQKNILKVSSVLKPEELKELQDAIDSLAPTANDLNKVSQLRQEYEKIEKAVASLSSKNIASIEDEEGLKKLREELEEINKEIDKFLNKEINLGGSDNSWTSEKKTGITNTLVDMENEVSFLSKRGLISEDRLQDWKQAQANFRSFFEQQSEGAFAEPAAQEYNKLAELAVASFNRILEEAQETNDNIRVDIDKTTRASKEDVASQQKEYTDKLARELKKQSNALEPKRRQQTIQGLVEVAGGIQSVGIAIENVRRIGSIWDDEDLSDNEKMAQTLTNIGQTAITITPAIFSLKEAFTSLRVAHPVLLALTVALSALTFIVPKILSIPSALEKAQDKLAKSTEEYKANADELKTLEDQLKNTNDQLRELYSIADKDLTITNKEDIKRLEAERIELQAQLDLKKQIAEQNARQLLTDALAAREEEKKSKEEPKKSSSYEKAIDLANREYSRAFDDTGTFKLPENNKFLLSDEYINIFETLFSSGGLDKNGQIISNYGQGILDLVQRGEEIVATGSQEQIKAFQDEIANYIINLSKDTTKYDAEKYANDILVRYGLEDSVSYKDDFWGKRFEENQGEKVDSEKLAEARAALANYLSLENQSAIQFSQELLAFFINFQTETNKNLEERKQQAEAIMAKADAVLPTLREKEFLTTNEAEYLKEIEETAAWYYNYNIDTIASSIFSDITEDQYEKIQTKFGEVDLENEKSIKGFLTWLDEYLGEFDPQKLLDKYYHGLSVMDVLKIMVGGEDASWENFKGEDSPTKAVETIASQITQDYNKAKDEISLIKAAQEQLSSKGTLSGWEQAGAFNDLLEESGKLEEWNNLLGYTSEEKIAWLEKYLNVSESIKELEDERESSLTDLKSEKGTLSTQIGAQIARINDLKTLQKDTAEGTDKWNNYEDQIAEAQGELGALQKEYNAIVDKIEQLQNVDEETAKLILSQYNTVQKLNKARTDDIINQETYNELYNTTLQRQLESLGITQESFTAFRAMTNTSEEMALNILTASKNMDAFKSVLPSKEEFDFSSFITDELEESQENIRGISLLYGDQIIQLGSLVQSMFGGRDLTKSAQQALYEPETLALAQAGFIEGDEESLTQFFENMKGYMGDTKTDFSFFITQYVKGFQEFSDTQLAFVKEVTGITDIELEKEYLKQQNAFQSLMSVDLPKQSEANFRDASVSLTKYSEEISNLEKILASLLGKEKLTNNELATLFDRENLANFQEGLEGNEIALRNFLDLFLVDAPDEIKTYVDTWISEWASTISTISTELRAALNEAFGGNVQMVNEYVQGQKGYNALETAFEPISEINFEGRKADKSSYSMQELFAIDATRTALNDLLKTEIPFNFFLQPEILTLIGEILEGDVAALNQLTEALSGLKETEDEDFGKNGGLLALGDETFEKYQANQKSQREKNRSKAGVSDLVLEDTADEILENDKALQKLEDQFDDTAEEAEEFREQLEDIAATVVIQEKSYASLRKTLDKYNDLLEDTEATSLDFEEANAEIAEALQGIFGDSVDLDFVDEYRDKIEAFAEGGEEAVNAFHDLQAAAQQEYILELQATLTGDDEARANLQSLLDEATYVDANGDIHLNADLDISSYVATLNDMIAKSQITMETANGLLKSIGYEAITGFDFVDSPDTSIENSGYVSILGFDLARWEMKTQQTGQIAVPKIIGTTPIDAPKAMSSSRPKSSGGRGGGGGSSKKTPSKPKTEKPKDEDTDPFHDINIKIQKLGENYEELEDKREGLLGDDLVDNLNKELDILDKQNEAYREKLRIAELLKRVQQEELSKQGVEFDANGQISNYEAILNAKLNALNDMINKYNHMSAEEQETYESTLEKAQEDYDKLVEDIEEYEELINDTVPEVQQELRDNLNKKIEIEMEKFKLAVDVRLDMGEAQREWNEFKNKVIKELDDEDILGGAKANLEDILSYYNTNGAGGGAIQSVTEQIRNTMIELNKINSSGWSSIYGENHQQALEDLKEYTDELKTQLEDVKDLTDEINESVLDTIDKIKGDFDKQIDAYSQVSDLIQHDMRVIELLYGEDEYGALGEFYDKQAESNKSQIEFLRMQTEFWKQQMAQADPGTEAWDAIKENYEESLSNLNDALEDALQNMIDKYTNAINDIFDKLEDKVTDGLGLDYVGEEWDLINRNADQYLDIINAAYAIQDSQQKYLDAINESADPSVQKRLNDLMNDQLKILREKEKITQYDVDRANMMLDIELKRIALEEQQQNKTKLRLRRDTQGNYTYQYVTDEDNIAAAREELAAAQNDLYNFDKAQYQNTLDEMYNTYREFQEKMLAIYEDTTMTDEERERQKTLIIEQYGQLINNMTAENAQIRKNLEESAFIDLANIYDTNIEQYQNMTQQEKDILLNDLVPAWDSGIQHMVNTFVSEGGFVPTCIEAFGKLDEAMQQYKGNVESITGTAGLNTDDLQQGVDTTVEAAEQLVGINDQLIDAANQEMNAIRDIISELDQLIAKYTEAKNAAVDAVNSGFSAYQGDQHQNALDYEKDNSSGSTGAAIDPSLPTLGQRMKYTSGRIYASPNGEEPSSSMRGGQEVVITQIQPGALKPYRVALNGQSLGWLDKTQLARFKSGGYTGEWGDYGKLAVLDEKELVLEKDDTANILAAVNIVRDIANDLDNMMMERLANISAGISIPSKDFASVAETIEQQVHIDASFPNVTSSDEIQNAFNNLVNVAAQRAMNSNR